MTSGEIMETSTYLTFTIDEEDFAVDVAGVREVLDYTAVTRVPRTPDFMKGVINLRGSVVPVVDMRLKFGLPEADQTVDTCIIVLEVEMDGEVTIIGAIADSVKEVFEMTSEDIEPPPRLGTRFDTEFISGMGKQNDDFIIILDVNKVFSTKELELFRQTEGGATPSISEPAPVEEHPSKGVDDSAAEADTDTEAVSNSSEQSTEPADKEGKLEEKTTADKTPGRTPSPKDTGKLKKSTDK